MTKSVSINEERNVTNALSKNKKKTLAEKLEETLLFRKCVHVFMCVYVRARV